MCHECIGRLHVQRIHNSQASHQSRRSPDSSIQVGSEDVPGSEEVPDDSNTESLNARRNEATLSESVGNETNAPNSQNEIPMPETLESALNLVPNSKYKQTLIKEIHRKSMPMAAKKTEVLKILQQPNLSPEADRRALQNHMAQKMKMPDPKPASSNKRKRTNGSDISSSQSFDRSLNESQESNRQGRTPAPARARTQQSPVYNSPPPPPPPAMYQPVMRLRAIDLPHIDLPSPNDSVNSNSSGNSSEQTIPARSRRPSTRSTDSEDTGHTNKGAPSRPTIPYKPQSAGAKSKHLRNPKETFGA